MPPVSGTGSSEPINAPFQVDTLTVGLPTVAMESTTHHPSFGSLPIPRWLVLVEAPHSLLSLLVHPKKTVNIRHAQDYQELSTCEAPKENSPMSIGESNDEQASSSSSYYSPTPSLRSTHHPSISQGMALANVSLVAFPSSFGDWVPGASLLSSLVARLQLLSFFASQLDTE
ncbi:hypothetical protein ASPNIDRAFT_38301 [Aspergillus niger ATCC 1015]|uniref:Uncharacterized protein n=1 Tax=Aspergillus niger (strain ATCC 1015 / CBS 113.46 / FGSC A1144 / LSHB Ac4 / NCTC 3858a / NRRL 328 / USDA 3528.7) TaxID=380704 RepID=G3YHA2_ASPNA|nr:hypothetical protein ASPNIDRAFT_38301 [Aspergillus niger ATCC 1015]